MRLLLKNIVSHDIVKVFSLTSLSTIIKIISSYITIKVIAVIVGPPGIAMIGQLQNFVSIITTFASGGINSGVVKYVSEIKDQETELKKYIAIGLKISLLFSAITSVLLFLTSNSCSKFIFGDYSYQYVFIWFAIAIIFLTINNYILSIINGLKQFKQYVIINIVTSISGLLFTLILVLYYKINGALIALVTYQSFVLIITLFITRNHGFLTRKYWIASYNKQIVKNFFRFSLMTFVSAATIPVSQLIIRGSIIDNLSLIEAGYWESINRISGLFLLFITTGFSVYYLPRLSELKQVSAIRKEVLITYKIVFPIITVGLTTLFFIKKTVISIVFSGEFSPVENLFFWQLIGDFFKILSWVLAFIMIAKSMTKVYIFTEIGFSVLLIILSNFLIHQNGIIGATQAYCINYFLYFLILLFVFRKLLANKEMKF